MWKLELYWTSFGWKSHNPFNSLGQFLVNKYCSQADGSVLGISKDVKKLGFFFHHSWIYSKGTRMFHNTTFFFLFVYVSIFWWKWIFIHQNYFNFSQAVASRLTKWLQFRVLLGFQLGGGGGGLLGRLKGNEWYVQIYK